MVADLEAVVATVDPPAPFALPGISQGAATCIAYTVRHPERVVFGRARRQLCLRTITVLKAN